MDCDGQEQPEPASRRSLGATEPGGASLGAAELDFIAWAGGGVLGTVALALRNGCGDDLCGLTEVRSHDSLRWFRRGLPRAGPF